ncbi:MAG: aminopeptidase [Ferruginibacter sp.]|nr:aminopeptidase [Cytophagales bacterium]
MKGKRALKRFLLLASLLGVAWGVWQRELVGYGWSQARGQLRVLRQVRPLAEVMADPSFPDSLKGRLRLIGEIRRYAVDSLGITDSESYTTVYDQRGKPILWVVTASEPYRLVAKEWKFPLLGTFSYKGFFDYDRCLKAERELKAQGYDTEISEVSAWSTLGWFRDPILSSMLYRSEGSLASLIIHELTHGTLFVKDNLEYNENLADFVGDYGALRFLARQYGTDSPPYRRYLDRKAYQDRYYRHVLRGARQLDSLYAAFRPGLAEARKNRLKKNLIREIVETMDTLSGTGRKRTPVSDSLLPNNAFFIGYQTYRKRQNAFEQEFRTRFGSNFPRYLAYLKKRYPSL